MQHVKTIRIWADVLLLPGGEVVIDASNLYVRHGVGDLAINTIGRRQLTGAPTNAVVEANATGIWLGYSRPSSLVAGEEDHAEYQALGFAETGLGRERLGPFHRSLGWQYSDAMFRAGIHVCQRLEDGDCDDTWNGAMAPLLDATPNITTGGSIGSISVSNQSDLVDRSHASKLGDEGQARERMRPVLPVNKTTPRDAAAEGIGERSQPAPDDDLRSPRASLTAPAAATAELNATTVPDMRSPVLPLAASAALALLLAALYARISSRQEALAHASRQRLVGLLQQHGPLTVTDLARGLSVDRSTALYHIRVLRRSASVTLAQQGRLVYVLLPGQVPPSLPPSFREGAAGVVLTVLKAAGGALSRADLHALASAVPQRQRNHVLRQLTDAGVLERAFVGNAEVVRLAQR